MTHGPTIAGSQFPEVLLHRLNSHIEENRLAGTDSWKMTLNQHVIHHFVPHVSHVHLSDLTRILKRTSEEFNVEYKANKTMLQGWVQHVRHLKKLGDSD